jgi:holin-like protein
MRAVRIVMQIILLYGFSILGNLIVTLLHIKFPGSIVGLILLWICLYMKWLNVKFVMDGANFLIAFLTLFFIPSTVGIVQYPELLTTNGLLLVFGVIVSTILAFIFTGKLSRTLERYEEQRGVK